MPLRRICLVADMHGHLPAIPPCDVLLIAGDNAPDYGASDIGSFRQVIWYNNRFKDWLHTVQQRTGATIFGIAGNHDFALFRHRISLEPDLPWTYLQDSGAEYEGLKIWGSPWVANCQGWAFNLEPRQLEHRFSRIPEDTDILLLHGPPYGHGDLAPVETPHYDQLASTEHAGSKEAYDAIVRVKPKLVVCGHIHESRGESDIGCSQIVNATLMDNDYRPVYGPIVVQLDAPSTAA